MPRVSKGPTGTARCMCESEQLANTVIFNWVNFNSTYYFVDTSIRATGPTSGIKPRNFNHPEGSEARESVVNANENVSKAAWVRGVYENSHMGELELQAPD
ncbi:hypothetical protein DFH09DRAFT_1077528 [Mycena vulgaris]|nr:hypothetical protein DFH09DRAFT_1077528 [Mycena vulgaris]